MHCLVLHSNTAYYIVYASLTATYLPVPYTVGVAASGELVWNQTDATYTIKANWTVPITYNLPETIVSFVVQRLTKGGSPYFFNPDPNFKEEVQAVRGTS